MSTLKKVFITIVEDKEHNSFLALARFFLFVMSFLYRFLVKTVRVLYNTFFFKECVLPCPVISIGNITWGGTGKTTLVDFLVKEVGRQGKKVAVLMRGYGSDEVMLLQKNNPSVDIIAGKNRYMTGMDYCKTHHPDVFILDDGFQHWKLQRSLDIVMINCLNPWGNGHLIPRGILREPISSLKRAHIVILNNVDGVSKETLLVIRKKISRFVSEDAIIEAICKPVYVYRAADPTTRIGFQILQGKRVVIFSGIGSPDSFKQCLERIKIPVVKNIVFADHHGYTQEELLELKNEYRQHPDVEIVSTEKDFMRNPDMITSIVNPLILKIELEIKQPYDALIRGLDRVLGT
jgi:tetraacyldisaccharide 4'-kinase